MKTNINLSVSLEVSGFEDKDPMDAWQHIIETVNKITADMPLHRIDSGTGAGQRNYEWEVVDGTDGQTLVDTIRRGVEDAGLTVDSCDMTEVEKGEPV